jgi:hypothetical protein
VPHLSYLRPAKATPPFADNYRRPAHNGPNNPDQRGPGLVGRGFSPGIKAPKNGAFRP